MKERGLPRGRGSPPPCHRSSPIGRPSGRCRRAVRRAVVPVAVTVMRGRRGGRRLRRRRAVGARRGTRMGQAGEAGEDHAAPHRRSHERTPNHGSHRGSPPSVISPTLHHRHLRLGLVPAESPLRDPPRGDVAASDVLGEAGWKTWVCLAGAPVAQWTERLTTDQKVGGSTASAHASGGPCGPYPLPLTPSVAHRSSCCPVWLMILRGVPRNSTTRPRLMNIDPSVPGPSSSGKKKKSWDPLPTNSRSA